MEANQISKSSEASKSQSEYKKVSETKSLKRLKDFVRREDLLGVDTDKAKITFTPDVLDFCQRHNYRIIGRSIYFSIGVM